MIDGIRNGMVMQRGQDDRSLIYVSGIEDGASISCKNQKGGDVPVFYRDGKLYGVPTGGPYVIKIGDQVYSDIYVGDVWLLTGQSNMEGNGDLTDRDLNYVPAEDIRNFYMMDYWAPAKNPLHHCAQAVDRVHIEQLNAWPQTPGTGAGPGLGFAVKMKEITGVPQGLIACAHGGTCLEHWNPETKGLGGAGSLYGAMLRRFITNGGHCAGILWFQGCQEAVNQEHEYFTQRTVNLFNNFRADFGKGHIDGRVPIVQAQIGRWDDDINGGKPFERSWTSVRKQQLDMADIVPKLDTVASVTYSTDDFVHICSEGVWAIGERMAESMVLLKWPEIKENFDLKPGMKLGAVKVVQDKIHSDFTRTIIHIENCHGNLVAYPRAMGFSLAGPDGEQEVSRHPFDAYVEGENIIVRIRMSFEQLKDRSLYYGYGCNPACNITDGTGAPVPCFGPIYFKDIMQ